MFMKFGNITKWNEAVHVKIGKTNAVNGYIHEQNGVNFT